MVTVGLNRYLHCNDASNLILMWPGVYAAEQSKTMFTEQNVPNVLKAKLNETETVKILEMPEYNENVIVKNNEECPSVDTLGFGFSGRGGGEGVWLISP